MKSPQRFCTLALLVASCGGSAHNGSAPKVTSQGTQARAYETKYRVGDYVVYGYTGSFFGQSGGVELTETIERVEGNRLWIHVKLENDGTTTEWIQVVDDTPENQASNTIAELYEVIDGQRVRIEDPNGPDLLRLYGPTLPACDGPPENVQTHEDNMCQVLDDNYVCTFVDATRNCGGKTMFMETFSSSEFLWTNTGAGIRADRDEPDWYWLVEVLDHSRRVKGHDGSPIRSAPPR